MREKSSSVLTSLSSRRPLRWAIVDQRPMVAGDAGCGLGQHLLERAQHQRQRRAELVADVGEEGGLGAVELGQRLGAPALLLVGAGRWRWRRRSGPRPGRRSPRSRRRTAGTGLRPATRKPAGRVLALAARSGARSPAAAARARPRSAAVAEARLEVVDRGRTPPVRSTSRAGQAARRSPGRSCGGAAGCPGSIPVAQASRGAAVVLEQIEQRERQVAAVGAEAALDRGSDLGSVVGASASSAASSRSEREPPLADDPLGLLGDHAQHAARRRRRRRAAGCRRRCGRSPRGSRCAPGTAAAPRPRWPRRSSSTVSDARPDVVPDLRPDSSGAAAERPRLLDAERRPVGVVVEEGELGAPRHPHGVARGRA